MADNLSTPRGGRRPSYNPDAFGQVAETIARFFGTARYLAIQSILVIVWILFNIIAVRERFDPYPFILLNLMFSTQAAYAAPLILLAQNRQTDRDRAQSEHDREMNARSVAAMDFLARETAAIRIALESKVDRADMDELLLRLQHALERLPERSPTLDLPAIGVSRLHEPSRGEPAEP